MSLLRSFFVLLIKLSFVMLQILQIMIFLIIWICLIFFRWYFLIVLLNRYDLLNLNSRSRLNCTLPWLFILLFFLSITFLVLFLAFDVISWCCGCLIALQYLLFKVQNWQFDFIFWLLFLINFDTISFFSHKQLLLIFQIQGNLSTLIMHFRLILDFNWHACYLILIFWTRNKITRTLLILIIILDI